ncbi:MAG TPA: ligand-binding protein SH3, partial [Deltaproteobacteria bacterium]|nr:ligand-binding protein SH3 [Deltaproteobacteria bacterium]
MKRYKGTEFQIFSEVPFKNFRVSKLLSIFSQIRIKFLVVTFSILVLNIGFTMSAVAQEDSEEALLEEALSGFDDENTAEDDDDVLSGFDDEEDEFETSEDSESLAIEEIWSSLYGSTGLSASYSYSKETPADKTQADWSGLTKLRPYFSLTWDAKIGENWKTRISGKAFYDLAYGMKDSETFSDEVLSELEKEAELREIYLEGSPFGNLDIKLGKQIVSWGVANSLRVVDVLNPTDDREFGMTDLEDIRLPIAMTKLDYYIGDLKLEAVAVHEIKFNKSAPFGSDFNPSTQKINEVIPESSAENTEYGLALIGTFSGW